MMLSLAFWLLALACSQIHGAWAISLSPTPTRTTPVAPIDAINPTVTGQIGINPVDIWPPSSVVAPIGTNTQYLTEIITDNFTVTKWIAATTDFGTATINITTNGQVQPTEIPQGFLVTNTSEGVLEIAMSPYVKTFMDDILPKLPACNPLLLRAEAAASSSTANAQTERRPRLLQPRMDPAVACTRTRASRFAQLAAEDEAFARQLVDLNGQVVRATGNDVVALANSGEAMAFGIEEMTLAEIIEVGMVVNPRILSGIITVGLVAIFDIIASIAFAYAVYQIAEGMWILKADPQPANIFTPTKSYDFSTATLSVSTPSECPTEVPCIGDMCQGGPDALCTLAWLDCPCDVSGISIGDKGFWGGSLLPMSDLIAGWKPPTPNTPMCMATGNNDTVTMEDDPWNTIFSQFCDTISKWDVQGIETDWNYCASVDSQPNIHFQFEYNGTNPGDCKIKCHDAYDGLQSACAYTSHIKYREGYAENSCGAAFYTVEQCNADSNRAV